MLGYGVKMAKTPVKEQATNKGCLCRRIVRPGMYEAACSQKTPRKKARKESNISIKKYHQRPTLGVRSDRRRRTPYVAVRKSHEPVNRAEAVSREARAAARPRAWAAMKNGTCGVVLVLVALASYSRTMRGGNNRMGCMDRYEAKAVARIKVKLAPWAALAMAVRTKRLVRAEGERARQVARVKGLKRKAAAVAVLLHRRRWRGDVKRRARAAQ